MALNGSIHVAASHRDILRAMLIVGYPSRSSALATVGPWRATLLRSMVRGYLTGGLGTTRYFRNLEQSEKGAMSFLMAQALTYWFAQEHMNISYVVHVRGARETFTPAALTTPLKAGGPYKPRARPDFVGRSRAHYHIFESKGRSGTVSTSLVNSALNQASMITTVNGQPPQTCVAACFGFKEAGITGRVVDPAPTDGFALKFDDTLAARKAYSFFLESEIRATSTELVDGFSCVSMEDGLIYGVDTKVLEALDAMIAEDRVARSAEPLLSLLEQREQSYRSRRDAKTSVGPEGILLRGDTEPHDQVRRRIRRRG